MSQEKGQETSGVRTRYRVLGVSAGDSQQENVLKVFADYSEAQAYAQFVESGGAFSQVRVEAFAAPKRRLFDEEDYRPIPRPGGLAKLVFFVGLLVGLACGAALGTFVALQLELQGRLFVYCICGCTVGGALPAYWVMNKLYGA